MVLNVYLTQFDLEFFEECQLVLDYYLAYVNDDDIPEVFCYEVDCFSFATVSDNGTVDKKDYKAVCDWIPKSNLLYTRSLNHHSVWEIKDGKWIQIAHGWVDDLYGSNPNPKYYYNDELVSLEECAQKVAHAYGDVGYTISYGFFDLEDSSRINQTRRYTYDEFINYLKKNN